MYCKNCGSALDIGADRCGACSFKVGHGKNYCYYCGEALDPSDKVCENCGNNTDAVAKPSTADLLKPHKSTVKTNSILSIISNFLALLLLASLIFLPIYELSLGMSFSLFDDIRYMAEYLFADSINVYYITFSLFAIFEVIFSFIGSITIVKQIIACFSNTFNIDDATLLKYNEIKKAGNTQKKNNFWKQNVYFSIIMYAAFDILFAKMFSEARLMGSFSGFSDYVIVIIGLLIGVLVLNGIVKSNDKKMRLKIAKEEYV